MLHRSLLFLLFCPLLSCAPALSERRPDEVPRPDGLVRFSVGAVTEGQVAALHLRDGTALLVFSLLGDLYRTGATGGEAVALTTGPAYDAEPALSPDGRMVAFRSDRDGAAAIYAIPVAGGSLQRLSPPGGSCALPLYSVDGKDLIYVRREGGRDSLYRQPAAGGTPQLLVATAGEVTGTALTREGRLLYTVLASAPGRKPESQVFLFPERTPRQVLPGRLGALAQHPEAGVVGRWQDESGAQLLWLPGGKEAQVLRRLQLTAGLPGIGLLGARGHLVVADEGRLLLLRADGSLAGEAHITARFTLPPPPRSLAPLPRETSLQPPPPVWLQGVTLIDGERGSRTPDTTLVLEGGRVAYVGPANAAPAPPPGSKVLDGRRRFAVPGLLDLSGQHGLDGRAYLAYGTTTVREAPGPERAATGPGPRFVRVAVAGPAPEGPAALIEHHKAAGLTQLHLDLRLPRAARQALLSEAARSGLHVSAAPASLEELVSAVLDGVELVFLPPGLALHEDVLRLLQSADVTVGSRLLPAGLAEDRMRHRFRNSNPVLFELAVPPQALLLHSAQVLGRATLQDQGPPIVAPGGAELARRIEHILAQVRALHQAGVRVAAASGAGSPGCFPGVALAWELSGIARAVSPLLALRAATTHAARALHAQDLGRLAVGSRADLVLLSADPLVDGAAYEQVVLSVRGGEVYRPEQLFVKR